MLSLTFSQAPCDYRIDYFAFLKSSEDNLHIQALPDFIEFDSERKQFVIG